MANDSMRESAGTVEKRGAGKRRHFYVPPSEIKDVPGVVKKRRDEYADFYTGAKADLVAAGLLTPALFPGEPGMGRGSTTLWPHGATSGSGWHIPGRMQVNRLQATDRFTIMLTVDETEQQRRKSEIQADYKRWQTEREAAEKRRRAERHAEQVLETLVEELGIDLVTKQVHRLHRKAHPLRDRAALRLVWSSPFA